MAHSMLSVSDNRISIIVSPPYRGSGADSGDVLSGGALLALHDVELHGLALGERLEALTLDRAVVDEAVLLAAVGRDEAKALGVVEPLHLAGGTHTGAPSGCPVGPGVPGRHDARGCCPRAGRPTGGRDGSACPDGRLSEHRKGTRHTPGP